MDARYDFRHRDCHSQDLSLQGSFQGPSRVDFSRLLHLVSFFSRLLRLVYFPNVSIGSVPRFYAADCGACYQWSKFSAGHSPLLRDDEEKFIVWYQDQSIPSFMCDASCGTGKTYTTTYATMKEPFFVGKYQNF
uniref:Uncharacterized protein n=1 Tax=Caenorhabditis japonica TaxID=281687 RepID=A0A8R1EAA4_CAEJA